MNVYLHETLRTKELTLHERAVATAVQCSTARSKSSPLLSQPGLRILLEVKVACQRSPRLGVLGGCLYKICDCRNRARARYRALVSPPCVPIATGGFVFLSFVYYTRAYAQMSLGFSNYLSSFVSLSW